MSVDSRPGPDHLLDESDLGTGLPVVVHTLADDSLPAGEGLVPTPTRPFDPKEHKAKTRKILALIALGVLAVFHGGLVALLACDVIELDELVGIIAASSGLQALTAVAFTFYFAKA